MPFCSPLPESFDDCRDCGHEHEVSELHICDCIDRRCKRHHDLRTCCGPNAIDPETTWDQVLDVLGISWSPEFTGGINVVTDDGLVHLACAEVWAWLRDTGRLVEAAKVLR